MTYFKVPYIGQRQYITGMYCRLLDYISNVQDLTGDAKRGGTYNLIMSTHISLSMRFTLRPYNLCLKQGKYNDKMDVRNYKRVCGT